MLSSAQSRRSKTAERKIFIAVGELKQLIFWAKVGTQKKGIRGGSFYPEVLSTIEECESKLKS